ncbi:MAG: ABC transporter substrate-binding protein [Oscillospiraceae bacterium]|nr:ABC transporter substrate-binding protein [Oscillospiraceae bacterium]
MKKLLALVLAMTMALSLAACGGSEETTTDEGTEKVKIGILQQLEHASLDEAREGFVQALADNGYVDGENMVLDYQNAQSDQSNLQTMADRLVNNENDLILAIATGAAQTLAAKTQDIPVLITAVTDPVDAGVVNSMENPGTNVSGTSDASPMKEQLELLLKLKENITTVGLLYTSSEDNSVLQINQVKAILDEMQVAYVEQTVTNSNDVQQAVQSLVTKCDGIYIPTDNVLASSMALVADITWPAGVPVVTGAESMVTDGGLATLGLSYYNLGYQTGEMAVRVLNGEDISTMPVETQNEYNYVVNNDAVKAMTGITIPRELEQYVQ